MNNYLKDYTTPTVEPKNYDQDLPKGDKANHNSEVRRRIDDLLEQKRLKALLDDADDWDF
tara:strand:+ start:994 stop:1173 length:180 start_codon:yes stop_codon:yes gene_type:complete